ncbi:MAG: hypothetical protein ABIJ41_04625 [Candidatus Omnitrophota bacterium]
MSKLLLSKRKKLADNKGLTLPELMVSAGILVLVIGGILFSYITCLDLSQFARNSSLAVRSSKARMEKIKNTPFAQIKANYDGVTFTATGLNGIGVSYVDDSNANLLLITTSFCWRQPNGRIIGEDLNLDGQYLGEDVNGNEMLDSIVQLTSYIYNG